MGQPKREKRQTQCMPAPGHSGAFRLNLTIEEPSDPRGRLDHLRRATESLRVQLDKHERSNRHLESLANDLNERTRKP